MFHQVQTKRAIRAMCTDSSLKEGHVYNHASNYLAVDYQLLYNNKINARVLIGQSAMVYCAGKPMEKSRVF